MKKKIALLVACVMAFGVAVGGTLAWLTAKTDDVTNVFTPSDISITLQEHKYDAEKDELTDEVTIKGVDNYKMVPGHTLPKDPWVTVKADSEDCWVFVKLEKSDNADTFLIYDIDPNNWMQLKDKNNQNVAGVYVTKGPVKDLTADRRIKVLGYTDTKGTEDEGDDEFVPNQVLVKDTVTKEMMNALTEATQPRLKFTAYASQLMKNNTEEFSAYEAWVNVQPTT